MSKPKQGQRERIVAGMIDAASRYGYGGASVARVVEQAGVSRATFYEYFADRGECFLAAHREVAGRIGRDVERVEHERAASERPREILAELLSNADLNPAAARLVTIEAMAGGPPVRAEHEKLLTAIEESIERYLDDDSGDGPRLEIPARALLGGVGSVMAIRAFRGETGRLIELLDDLLAWVDSYTVPSERPRLSGVEWEELGAGLATSIEGPSAEDSPDRRLPRGCSALPARIVASEHRERILLAVARLAREKGYTAMTVADIVATAAVTRESFYELFRSKEDAFLAAQAMGLQESVSRAAGAFFAGATWPDRVWDGLEAMLSYVAVQPDLVCVDIIESYAAGPAAVRRSFDNRMAFTLFLEDGYRQRPEAERLSRLCSEAIGGAILELLRCKVIRDETAGMLEILPQVAYVALAPFIGPVDAMRLVQAKVAAETPSERSPAPPAAG